jgi:hypothetical protein
LYALPSDWLGFVPEIGSYREVSQGANLQTDAVLEEEEENSSAVYIKIKRLPPLDSRDNVSQIHMHHQKVFQKLLPTENQYAFAVTPATTVQTPQSSRNDETGPEQGPTHRNITIDQAEELLQGFHRMKHFFPFIVVPEEATIKSLSRNSPFLLLAMFCAASAKDIQLVHHLDHEFKRVLSEKIICEGRRSLDFLQGLLVYVAWLVLRIRGRITLTLGRYPCHLKPKNQQAFMYINLALSILDDLGIGRRDCITTSLCPDNVEYEGLMDDVGFSKPAQRAYLGCYYLSSA